MPEATLVVKLSFKIKAVYFCYNVRESNQGDYTFWSAREGLIFQLADYRMLFRLSLQPWLSQCTHGTPHPMAGCTG